MKKIMMVVSLLLVAPMVLAEDYEQDAKYMQKMEGVPLAPEGMRHMLEFNTESVISGLISIDKSKGQGTDADNDVRTDLSFNYAYGVARNLQIGVRFNYFNGVEGNADKENYDLSVGGIFNFDEDFLNTTYTSLYLGTGSRQIFSNGGHTNQRDEVQITTLALGKRASLEKLGLKQVTWNPELAYRNENSTSNEGYDYLQSLEVRFLQFAVFF